MKLHILVNFPNGTTVCQPVSIILVFRNVILSKSWMFILNKTLSFNFLNFLSFFKFTLFDLPGKNPLQTLTWSIPDFFQSFQKVEFFICNYYKSPLKGILVNCLDRISAYPYNFSDRRFSGLCRFTVNIKNIRKRCERCSELTIKTPERRHWLRSIVFVVNFGHISHFFLVFL